MQQGEHARWYAKADYLKGLGADETINYKEADWAGARRQGFRPHPRRSRLRGRLEEGRRRAQERNDFIANFATQAAADDKVNFKNFLLKSIAFLDVLVAMVEKGTLKVPIDTVYNFKDVPAALKKSFELASSKGGTMGELLVGCRTDTVWSRG